MRVVQIIKDSERKIAIVQGSKLILLKDYKSLYDLAKAADHENKLITDVAYNNRSVDYLDYNKIYAKQSLWSILPAFDHPYDTAHCLITGTGLTHLSSAMGRDTMHRDSQHSKISTPETDTLKMYRMGVEGGKPKSGTIGTSPEWFYKGSGAIVRASGDGLEIPSYAQSSGEEAELTGLYIIGKKGLPRRIGFAAGNEFSDHKLEKSNYLYLGHSKLRQCSIGPEAIIGINLKNKITGLVTIKRDHKLIYKNNVQTGTCNMCHSLRNIEFHHFKYDQNRIIGDAHIHFLGAAGLSYSSGVRLVANDIVTIRWSGFGKPLINKLVLTRKRKECYTFNAL